MNIIKCNICQQEFKHEFKGSEKKLLGKHLREIHGLTPQEYILKYEYNNIKPLCACGCGNETKYQKWKYLKYYKDHKNHVKLTEEKQKRKEKVIVDDFEKRRHKNLTIEELKKYWNLYISKQEYSGRRLHKEFGIDFRTLKRYWRITGIITEDEIQRYKIWHQFKGCKGEKNGTYKKIDEDVLIEMMLYLESQPSHSVTLTYLRHNFIDFKIHTSTIYNKLIEQFEKGYVDKFLKNHSSQGERDFRYILEYYFGKENINKQFKIHYKDYQYKRSGRWKSYDYCLFNKILIEFDGKYWHSSQHAIQNDKLKDKIAQDNNFIIFRVKEKDAHKIETLIKIKELVDEIQINKN